MTRLGKRLVVVPAVLLALSGCGGGKAAAPPPDVTPVPGRVLLSVTASRPAGTLEVLPDLTWSLTGATGLSLVVRAQGPGASAPGVGFAGVRVASGPVRYLAASGTWSEAEVVYAAAAGTGGTIRPAAPLLAEGEWRFDLIARDAAGLVQATALAAVVLSSKPALRVTLAQRFAAAGDAVEGRVVLARGSTARPVKLLAWWQGPGGVAVRLPEGAPLAFDGPSADVSLPILARRLDGAAPGAWSLVARLFDAATGAPLGYGEQSLQVCAGTSPITGTVRGAGGAPLGAGAGLAEVQALSVDRQARVTSPVGAAGDFSLALEPGAWAIAALVVDAAGAHRVPVQSIQVGCSVAAPLLLDAEPPVRSVRSSLAVAAPAPAPLARRAAAAPTQRPEQVQIILFGAQAENANAIIGADGLTLVMETVATRVGTATSNGVSLNTIGLLTGLQRANQLQQQLGADATRIDASIRNMVGGHLSASMTASKVSPTEVDITLKIIDGQGNPIRDLRRRATVDTLFSAAESMAQEASGGSPSLLDAVRLVADFPQNPVLSVVSSFGTVLPSSQHDVKVHLQDSHGNTYAGRTVYLDRRPTDFPASPSAVTDASGDATFSVLLGVADLEETIKASYSNRIGKPFPSDPLTYAIQRAQTGQVQFSATVPVVRPGGSAVLQVTSRDPTTGAPQVAAPMTFSADLGGAQGTATAITDAAGLAGVVIPAGTAVGLGRVTAVASAASPAPPDAGRATENLVVSSPAALNLTGPTGTVLPGAQVPLSGSLQLDGLPMPGATVTFTSAGAGGGGTLSVATVPVDETGSFQATFQPPPSGTGNATVTASVQVEGQAVTRDVAVSWLDAVKKIALSCNLTSAADSDICVVNPDGTGLTHLTSTAGPGVRNASWSLDHSRIAFECQPGLLGICTVNPDGTGMKLVRGTAQQSMVTPSLSPDGSRIAVFYFASPNTNTIATFNAADGSGFNLLPLPPTVCLMQDPAWSPDGLRIAVMGFKDGTSTCTGGGPSEMSIYTMDPDGSNVTRLTGGAGQDFKPAWSPDGTRIAFHRNGAAVWVMSADGSGQARLATGWHPAWSPDGTQIAFHWFDAATSLGTTIVMNADGSSQTVILTGDEYGYPSW